MNDAWIAVIGTVSGAAFGFLGGAITTWLQQRASRDLWERSQQQAHLQSLYAEVKEFADHATAITKQMCWVAWMAMESPSEVGRRQFNDYDELARSALTHMMASLAIIGLLDTGKTVHPRLIRLHRSIEASDILVGKAGIELRSGNDDWIGMLTMNYPDLVRVYRSVGTTLADLSSHAKTS